MAAADRRPFTTASADTDHRHPFSSRPYRFGGLSAATLRRATLHVGHGIFANSKPSSQSGRTRSGALPSLLSPSWPRRGRDRARRHQRPCLLEIGVRAIAGLSPPRRRRYVADWRALLRSANRRRPLARADYAVVMSGDDLFCRRQGGGKEF